MGLEGVKWIGKCMSEVREWKGTRETFFKFFCDIYHAIELVCSKNNGGLYVEISEYHSGSRKGVIRVLEGRKLHGRAFFEAVLQVHTS
jgi:hypothetical protein